MDNQKKGIYNEFDALQQSIKTEYIWMNGEHISWNSAMDHHVIHGLHYGSGVFEGIRFYNTDDGVKIFRLEEHIDRLFFSAEKMCYTIPYTKKEIMLAVKESVDKSGLDSGYIRPIAYPGEGKMGVSIGDSKIKVAISVWKWGTYISDGAIRVKITRTTRNSPTSTCMEAKICGNYANGVMASNELIGTEYKQGLLLDHEGYIAEGPGANIFFVKGSDVFTPQAGTILPGITRDTIIKLLQSEFNITVQQIKVHPKDLDEYSESFMVGTAAEVTAIGSITTNDYEVFHFTSGEDLSLTQKIKKCYLDVVYGRDKKFSNWLS